MLVIVDYGVGNVGSIKNMLRKAGVDAVVTCDLDQIAEAKRLVLPGVGAFDHAMDRLRALELIPLLNKKALEDRTPILGICLGMQLLTKRSEEGITPGLGWINAETRRFNFNQSKAALRVPHMGWNTVEAQGSATILTNTVNERFYFVHSYHVICADDSDVMALTEYGYPFASAVRRDNIMGVQFHPEKSHRYGLALMKRFASI
jgi:glutamine amidotransferase